MKKLNLVCLFFSLFSLGEYSTAFACDQWQIEAARGKTAFSQLNYSRSLFFYRKALVLAKKGGASAIEQLQILTSLAISSLELGKSKECQSYLTLGESIINQEGGFTNAEHFRGLRSIGAVYQLLKEPKLAIRFFERASELKGIEDKEYGSLLNQLGLAYLEAGNFIDAEKSLKAALLTTQRAKLASSDDIAAVFYNLGLLLKESSNFAEAEKSFLEALKHLTRTPCSERALIVENLAHLYLMQNLKDKASEILEQEIKMIESRDGLTSSLLPGLLSELGNSYLSAGTIEKAKELYLRALRIDQARSNSQGMRRDLDRLGALFYKAQNYDKARLIIKKKVALEESLYGETDSRLLGSLRTYLMILEQVEAKREARIIEARIGVIMLSPPIKNCLENLKPKDLHAAMPAILGYIECLEKANMYAEAKRVRRKVELIKAL
jgi:tetratricopeptide (TPR) repeat protein